MEHALELAIEKAGGTTKLARAIGGITPQAVSQWKVCPVNRVIQVETLTGISRHELRPDIFGEAPPEAVAS